MRKIHPAPVRVTPNPQARAKENTIGSHILRSHNNIGKDNFDDSIVDLEYDKNLTKIDYGQMKLAMKANHPTKANGEFYSCEDACCKFDSGSHYCTESSEKSDLTKFGVGILLYFKFVKHFMFYFFLFTLLSIPGFVLYGAAYSAYKTNDGGISYVDLLTATTVGSLGFASSSCGIAKYPTYASSAAETEIYFECLEGEIGDISTISFGFTNTGNTCAYIEDTDLEIGCNLYDATTLSSDFSSCVGKESCTFTIPTNMFVPEASSATCKQIYKTQNVYIRVTCSSTTLTLFDNVEIKKSTIALLISVIDAVIILVFLAMVFTLKYAQKSATDNVLKKAYSSSAYTVQIKNLPQDMPSEELAARLWTFLDYKLGNKESYGNHRVVDIQIVLPNKIIMLSKEIGEIIREKNTLIREWMQLFAPEYDGKEIDMRGVYSQLLNLKQKRSQNLREAARAYKKIKELALKKEKLLVEVQKLKASKEVRIVCAFVTFSSIPARNRILDLFASSPLDRFARIFCSSCYDKDISFYGKILRAKSADDPGSILWENLGEPGISIFLRRATSAFLTIVMWIVSGTILLVSTYYKNDFKQKYPSIDCAGKNPTMAEAASDYLLGEYQTGLLGCFCSADVLGRLNDVFTTADNQKLCHKWLMNKIVEGGVTIGIVFAVLIVNYGIQFIFQGLSKFERHSTLNKQLAQRVIKTFVAQFLNTGILILLINAKLEKISFWQGRFRDISPLWYENVGSTLLATMFINIFTVPTIKIIFVLFNKIRRWCDRRRTPDERITKQKTQRAYENLYMGPEFIIDFRYSQIMTLTFVCFLYSGGMPLLYFTSLAQLVITYFFDKIFCKSISLALFLIRIVLRVCKLPKNYDEKLEKVVRTTLYGIILLHLVFTIYMYGNPDIFDQTTSTLTSVTKTVNSIAENISDNSENVFLQFFKRATLQHNIPLLVILIIVAVVFAIFGLFFGCLRNSVFAIFSKDKDETRKETSRRVGKKKVVAPTYTFFHLLKKPDIETLIRLTKVTIKTTQNEDLIMLLKKKLSLLKAEYSQKKNMELQGVKTPGVNFIGFFSYDVRLNPTYKDQFAIEEQLDDEDLS